MASTSKFLDQTGLTYLWNKINAAFVPQTRTVNSKALSSDISLSYTDVSAAPTSHASSSTTYGIGTTDNYGHVKTAENLTTSQATDGLALGAYQGKILQGEIDTLNSDINTLDSNKASITGLADGTYPKIKGGSKAMIYTDTNEGGGVQILSKSGYVTELDSHNDSVIRFVSRNAADTAWHTLSWNRDDDINLSALNSKFDGPTWLTNLSTSSIAYTKFAGIVTISNYANIGIAIPSNTWTTLGTLPTGYRPSRRLDVACTVGYNANLSGVIRITSAGNIELWSNTALTASSAYLSFTVSYPV